MFSFIHCKKDNRGHSRGIQPLKIQLFSSVKELPPNHWNHHATGGNVFLSTDYFRALERSGELLRYALFFKGDQAVGAASFQVALFEGAAPGSYLDMSCALTDAMLKPIPFLHKPLRRNMVVCGSPFSAGEHGYHFAPSVSPTCAAFALAEAARMAAQEFRQALPIQGILLKELFPASTEIGTALADNRFTQFPTEPSMVLPVHPSWHSFEDYLGSMASKYRVKARRTHMLSASLEKRDLQLSDLIHLRPLLADLYNAVVERAANRLGGLGVDTLFQLRRYMGSEFILTGYFLNGNPVGFLMGFENGNTLEAGFVGIDYRYNKSHAVYSRMLYDYLNLAISRGLEAVNYGRTAGEIKSSVGAVPVETTCCLHLGNSAMDAIMPIFSDRIRPASFPTRKPFKKAWYANGKPALIAKLQGVSGATKTSAQTS